MSSARIDRWLWAVRLAKTRAAAKDAIVGGHVSVNGQKVKPSHHVTAGDRVEARVGGRDRIVEVIEAIEKRVGAARAAECIVDHSPPPPERAHEPLMAKRDAGTGRPTKRDRRQIDRLQGR